VELVLKAMNKPLETEHPAGQNRFKMQ
jgi:hypothetical protein